MACSAAPKCNDRIQQIGTLSAFGSGPLAGVLALLHYGLPTKPAVEKRLEKVRCEASFRIAALVPEAEAAALADK